MKASLQFFSSVSEFPKTVVWENEAVSMLLHLSDSVAAQTSVFTMLKSISESVLHLGTEAPREVYIQDSSTFFPHL